MATTSKKIKSSERHSAPAEPITAKKLSMYWIAFNIALEPDVLELLEHAQVKAFTRWDDIKGSGNSGPHLNDEVWPAVNGLVMLVADAALEDLLAKGVLSIRQLFPGEGIKLIIQPCAAIY